MAELYTLHLSASLALAGLVTGAVALPAQTAARHAVVITSSTGAPIANAMVAIGIDGPARFTDSGGTAVIPGSTVTRITVAKPGFRAVELSIQGRAATDTIRISLQPWRPRFSSIPPASSVRCGVAGRTPARDTAAHGIIDQVLLNARQYRLLARGYPYIWASRRQMFAGGRAQTRAVELLDTDTVLASSDRDWRYRTGNLASSMENDSLGAQPTIAVGVTLADLADSAFIADHCFQYRGVERVDARWLARIDFREARPGGAKGSGSVFLDTATLRARRLTFAASRHFETVSNTERYEELTAVTSFKEPVTGMPVPDLVVATTHAQARSGPGGAMRHFVHREDRQFIGFVAISASSSDPSPLRALLAATDSLRGRYAAELAEMVGDSIGRATYGFVRRWRGAWQMSEVARHPVRDSTVSLWVAKPNPWSGVDTVRRRLLHCHLEIADTTIVPFRDRAIQSGAGKRSICPSWTLDSIGTVDEGEWIDGAIAPDRRQAIRAARDSLLDALVREATRRPDDAWTIGQLVRFAVDQRDEPRADTALAMCQSAAWWCLALEGYVRHTRGELGAADSAFAGALDAMPDSLHCAWTDVGPLLYPAERARYQRVPCTERDSLNARFWWLSDPLWIEPGNERRSAHFARHVLARLRTDGRFPERWEANPLYGGVSVAEMIVRYGWPTMSWWGGSGEDASHFGYLGVASTRRRLHGVFSTAEYSTDRPHVVPRLSAVEDPFGAKAGDWFLAPPRAALTGQPDATWWPMEHYRRRGGMLHQLWDQTAMFRRQTGVLLAMSTHVLPEAVGAVDGDTLTARLLVAYGPDSIEAKVGRFATASASVIQTMVSSDPFLLGLEVFGPQGLDGLASRTRFSVRPPPPLAGMRPGELAISDPAFLMPAPSGETPVVDPRLALARLLPNTTFTSAGRIGMYWEVYGARGDERAAISVIAIRGRDTVVLSPSSVPGRLQPGSDGDVPIQTYNLTVDLSYLTPAEYSLEVRATLNGNVVTGRRSLFLVTGKERVEPIIAEPAPFGPSEDQWINGMIAVARAVKPRGSPMFPPSRDEFVLMIADSAGYYVPKPGTSLTGVTNPMVRLSALNPTTERMFVQAVVNYPGQMTSQMSCWRVARVNGRWTAQLVGPPGDFPNNPELAATNNNPARTCGDKSDR